MGTRADNSMHVGTRADNSMHVGTRAGNLQCSYKERCVLDVFHPL